MRPMDVEDFVTEQNEYVWNEGDVDGMRRYYAPWYVHHDFARPDVRSLRGPQGWTRQLLSSLQGLHVQVDVGWWPRGRGTKARRRAGHRRDLRLGAIPYLGNFFLWIGVGAFAGKPVAVGVTVLLFGIYTSAS